MISLSTRTIQALFTLADLLLPKELLAVTLSTLAHLYYSNFRELKNRQQSVSSLCENGIAK